MGGSTFSRKGIDTVRLPLEDYREVSDRVLARINEIAPDYHAVIIPHYRSKLDFGDLDIVVPRRLFDQFTPEELCDAFSGMAWSRGSLRDPVISVAMETPAGPFQVDLISALPQNLDYAIRFFSWGDAGALVSGIARQMGLKHGAEGLRYTVDHPRGRITVPLYATYSDALEFLGLDDTKHRAGFNTPEDVYAWIASSPYFDPKIYDPKRLTNGSRRRAIHRPFYQGFLAWIEGLPGTYDWGPRDSKKDEWRPRIFDRFPHAPAFVEAAIEKISTSRRETIFNGAYVSAIAGVTDPHLQHLMNAVRTYLGPRLATIEANENTAELDNAIREVARTDYLPKALRS